VAAVRQHWRPWGASLETPRSFQRFGVEASRSFVLSPQGVLRIEGAWVDGRGLDRFSRFNFDAVDNRLRGYPSAALRYDRGGALRTVATVAVAPQVRASAFLDVARVRDPGQGEGSRTYPGAGAALDLPLFWRSVAALDWGYGFQAPNRDGKAGCARLSASRSTSSSSSGLHWRHGSQDSRDAAPRGRPLAVPVLSGASGRRRCSGKGHATPGSCSWASSRETTKTSPGRPFVGPAGRLFDRALAEAGIDRTQVYLTNVVKHFKWIPRGKKRIHAKPDRLEVTACRPWLDAEIEVVKPEVLVCLGATAAQALLGNTFRVTQRRGELIPSPLAPKVTATVHPSAILRAPDDETRRLEMRRFVADLKSVKELLEATRRASPRA
jgi:DNA polymerase